MTVATGTPAVVDAGVLVDALLPGPRRAPARRAMDPYTLLTAPEHLRIEVAQVLRRYARDDLGEAAATAILRTLAELELDVVPTSELLPRVWDLRGTLTCYDAAYLAAAELRGVPLLTRDAALIAHADRARCRVIAVG